MSLKKNSGADNSNLDNQQSTGHAMAWDDNGGGNGSRDPWGGKRGNQGPPDLDEVVRKLQAKFGAVFGGGGGKSSGGTGGRSASIGVGLIFVVVTVLWLLSGLYIVDQAEQGVVLQFGKYTETTEPGLRWHIPYPIESKTKVNISEIQTAEVGYRSRGDEISSVGHESLMLTQDENIIDIAFAVQYRIKDARDFLFNVREPGLTLHQVTESAVREIVGKNDMDSLITEGRSDFAVISEELIQTILDRYETGLLVTSVNTQRAQPPGQVKEAFDDANKAREDKERKKNEAEAYANDILPKARGDATRLREEARGYKARVIALATGETRRFEKVLTEYERAPEITRQRLYIEAVESMLSNSSKVIVDVEGGNNILYLPLDRIMDRGNQSQAVMADDAPVGFTADAATRETLQRLRDSLRQDPQRGVLRNRGGR